MAAELTDSKLLDVPETRFGIWFQGTETWRRYVLVETLATLDRLLGRPGARFARVLDVGCGQGMALPLLDERFEPEHLIGIDLDPRMVGVARGVASRCRGRVEVRELHLRELDLADGSIDLVFCHQTLHHVREQMHALGELHRVLRPGGVLLFAESCRAFIALPWVRLLFRHPMDAQHTAEEYLELLRRAGFAFSPEAVATPDPWWSRRDLGISRRPIVNGSDHTLVCVAATRAAQVH